MTDELATQVKDGIALLTLCVPRKRNALTSGLRLELRAALRRLDADPACRAIVLTGAGGAFCSGGDIEGMDGDPQSARERLGVLHDVVRLVAAGGTPVVAAVRGPAFGGGFALAMAADVVVAEPTARFCASFARIGLMPDLGLLWSLPGRVGAARARRLVMEAREIGAAEALRLGIADEVTAEGEHVARARALAESLSRPRARAASVCQGGARRTRRLGGRARRRDDGAARADGERVPPDRARRVPRATV